MSLWDGHPSNCGLTPARGKRFLLSTYQPDYCGSHPAWVRVAGASSLLVAAVYHWGWEWV